MTIEDALLIVDAALMQRRLNNVQELLFRQSWEGKKYQEIGEMSGYDAAYIRDVGYRLWQTLSESLGERVTKNNLQVVFRRQAMKMSAGRMSQVQGSVALPYTRLSNQLMVENHEFITQACDMTNSSETSELGSTSNVIDFIKAKESKQRDWGNAIDTSIFFGREAELAALKQWIICDRCRLVGIFGIGGIGKTAFAVKLAEQIQDDFEYVIWRSLRNAPPIEEMLGDLIKFLSNQPEIDLPNTADRLLSCLMNYLRNNRCLLILDNAESILQSGAPTGCYRQGYEGYSDLLRQVGETRHQSCLILTSREKPDELSPPDGETLMVRSLQLPGLKDEALSIFIKGLSDTTAASGKKLIDYYRGNPLALKVVSRSIQELFDGDIAEFLTHGTSVFSGIRHLLEQQYNRLSDLEKQVMYWLAINREPVSALELLDDIVPIVSKSKLLEALCSLRWRSLIEKSSSGFTQQPVVMEYVTDQLIEQAYEAIIKGEVEFLMSYALIKAQAKDYIRENQLRVIVKPLVAKLTANFGTKQILNNHLSELLCQLRNPNIAPSYGTGNVIKLLHQVQVEELTTSTGFPIEVTDLSDLRILQKLLESERAGGLATWDHRIPWANNPLSQVTSETKTQISNRNLYYQWLEGSLEELQQELKQQGRLRKRYCAWLNDTDFAEIDADFEAVQITDALNQRVDARLVFMNEVKIIQPPQGLLTPPERMALANSLRN